MPLDPSIPLGIVPPKINTPFENLDIVMQAQQRQQAVRSNQAKLDADARKLKEQDAVQRVLQETQGDWEVALPRIRQIAPTLSLDIEKQIGDARKSAADALKVDLDNEKATTERGLSLLRAIPPGDDAMYQQIRPMLAQMIPDMAPLLPERYDPAAIQALNNAGMTAQQYADQQAKGLDRIIEGEWREGAGAVLSTATDQAEWDEMLAGFRELGMPKAEIAQFGAQYSPEAAQKAAALSMTPKDRAAVADQAEGRVIQREQNAAMAADRAVDNKRADAQLNVSRGQLSVAQQRLKQGDSADRVLVPIIGPDGKPVLVPRSQAVGQRPAGSGSGSALATGAQRKNLAFFNRAKQAADDLAELEAEVAKMGYAGQKWMQSMPNALQSQTGQSYNQAQRAFTEARLRKDSGAAIPDAEFENDRQTYFAQPGDSAATLAQKARARAAVLASLAFESGGALEEFYGEEAASMVEGYKGKASKQVPAKGEIDVTVNPFRKK